MGKDMKKLLILLLAFIIAGCSATNNKKNNDSLYLPIINTKNNKSGFIDAENGRLVIEPQFVSSDNVMSFDTYSNQYTIIWDESNWKIIDNQGKITFDTSKQKKDYVLVSQFFDSNGNVYAVYENNKYVKINGNGSIESTEYYPYTSLYDINIQNPELVCYSKKNDDYYYALDDKQNVIFKSKYPFVFKNKTSGIKDIYDENIGICLIDTGKDGTVVDKYDFYFIDNKGNKLLDGKIFDGANSFTKKGYAYVFTADISYITDNEDNIIYMSRDNKVKPCIINNDGKEIYELENNEKAYFTDKSYYINYYEQVKCGIKNSKEKIIIDPKYDSIDIYGNYFIAYDNDNKKCDLYNTNGKIIKSIKNVDSLKTINKYIIINNQYIYNFEGGEMVNIKEIDKNLQINLNNTQFTGFID